MVFGNLLDRCMHRALTTEVTKVHGGIVHKLLRTIDARMSALCCLAVFACCAGSAAASEIAVLRNGFSIRHDHHAVMGSTTRLFLSKDDSSFTDVPTVDISGFEKDLSLPEATAAAPAQKPPIDKRISFSPQFSNHPAVDLNQVVDSASSEYHLDPDLVNSVIHAESGFNTNAVSPKGARGLMQLMPSTASKLGVRDPFDSEDNVGGGSRYLRELLERYNFDLVKALAAYNAGPERVDHYNGVPPYYETRAYVARIVHEYNRKKIAQEKAAAQKEKATLESTKRTAPVRVRSARPKAATSGTASRPAKNGASSRTQLASTSASTASTR
jgi:hypothetical protein